MNAGNNSQCQPSNRARIAAMARSSRSSVGESARSAYIGIMKISMASVTSSRIIALQKLHEEESDVEVPWHTISSIQSILRCSGNFQLIAL